MWVISIRCWYGNRSPQRHGDMFCNTGFVGITETAVSESRGPFCWMPVVSASSAPLRWTGLNDPVYDVFPVAESVHLVKSTGCLHFGQEWGLSNSSEKTSISLPHSGHLHSKEDKLLNCSQPGQLRGVLISFSFSSRLESGVHHSGCFPGYFSSSGASSPLIFVPQLGHKISISFAGPVYFSFISSGGIKEISPHAH